MVRWHRQNDKLVLIIFIIGIVFAITSCRPTRLTPNDQLPQIDSRTILLDNIASLETGMPRAGSGNYVIPNDEDLKKVTALVEHITFQQNELAQQDASAIGYHITASRENDDPKKPFYLLQEANNPPKGWGLYGLRPSSNSSLIIEAPHPLADIGTTRLAADLFHALNARAILIAGAHRDANPNDMADMAHEPQSIYHEVQLSAITQAFHTTGDAVVIQLHGYSSSRHPNLPQIIIGASNGKNNCVRRHLQMMELSSRLKSELEKMGYSVGLCLEDEYDGLCGTRNVMSQKAHHALFFHIELSRDVRHDPGNFVKALQKAFVP